MSTSTSSVQQIWFGTRAVRFEGGGNTGPQYELIDDNSDFFSRTYNWGTFDTTGSEWQQFLAFTGSLAEQQAIGIDLSDGVDTAAYGQVNSSGDLRVGGGIDAYNLADMSGGGRLVDTTGTLDETDDPLIITGLGRSAGNVLDAASFDAGDTGNRVVFSNDLGFGFIGGAGWDPGGNALRLNDGESVNFEIGQDRVLLRAGFTVKVLGNAATSVVVDSDGETIRDENGAEPGGLVQDGSAGELDLGVLAHGTKVAIDYVNRSILLDGIGFAGDTDGFFDAFAAGGWTDLTIGSLVGNQVGWSADNLVLTTAEDVPAPIAPVALSAIAAGTGGFKILGENSFDEAGWSVSKAGDVDGDGLDDVIVAGRLNDAAGSNAGAAYVVFGKAGTATVDLDDIATGASSLGFKILGENGGDEMAYSVSTAGDVNGDGLADLVMGALYNDAGGGDSGAAYVVFGKAGGATINLDSIATGTSSLGFKIIGENGGDLAGYNISDAGDVNGDGLADVIVGAVRHNSVAGAAYVVFGKTSGGTVNLDDIATGASTLGFKIVAESGQAQPDTGHGVSSLGDMNGDGLADLLVGANGVDAGSFNLGAAYVVWGKADGAKVNLDTIAAGGSTLGFRVLGEFPGDELGVSVSGLGDVNGDGIADLVVGALRQDAGGTDSGSAYVVFGKADGGNIAASDIAAGIGGHGFKIIGENAGDWAGYPVSDAGDLNGDGLADILVGAHRNESPGHTDNGAAYVVFGKADGVTVNLDDLAAGTSLAGFKIFGEANADYAGYGISAAGDVNNDGYDDLIVGAPYNDSDGADRNGAAYVIFGQADWTW